MTQEVKPIGAATEASEAPAPAEAKPKANAKAKATEAKATKTVDSKPKTAHYVRFTAKTNGGKEETSIVLYVAVFKAGKRGGASQPLTVTETKLKELLKKASA